VYILRGGTKLLENLLTENGDPIAGRRNDLGKESTHSDNLVRSVPCNAARLITRPARSELLMESKMRRTGHNHAGSPATRLRTIPPQNWVGTFAEYLDIVRERPEVRGRVSTHLRMICSYGVMSRREPRKPRTIASLMTRTIPAATRCLARRAASSSGECVKSAAAGYGIERRVLLLHGPLAAQEHGLPGC